MSDTPRNDNKATVTVPEAMLSMARELREYAQLLDPQLSLRRMLFEAIHVLETGTQSATPDAQIIPEGSPAVVPPEQTAAGRENELITALNHWQFLELEYLRPIFKAAHELYANSEEYDFDDGLGRGAPQDLWDALASSFEPATEAIAAVVPPEPWIPVTERLPEDSNEYLVAPGWAATVSIEPFIPDRKCFLMELSEGKRVTHWMPLPAAPDAKKQQKEQNG